MGALKVWDGTKWNYATVAASDIRMVGEITPWLGLGTPPVGWFDLDGSVKVRAESPELFALIGTAYNTSGETALQYRLPDFRGLTLVQLDAAQTEFNTIGKKGGSKEVTLTMNQLANHYHQEVFYNGAPGAGTVGYQGAPGTPNWAKNPGSSSVRGYMGTDSGAVGQPHNNLQPYAVTRSLVRWTTSVNFPGLNANIDGAQIASGTVDVARLPVRALRTQITVAAGGTFRWTYPTPFPNACLFVDANQAGVTNSPYGPIGPCRPEIITKDYTDFRTVGYTGAALTNVDFVLYAIGN